MKPGNPLCKDGDLVSNAYADWVRSQPCTWCGKASRSEHHHFPGKGRAGATNDLKSIPVCRRCHMRCEGLVVVEKGQRLQPFTADEQELAVHETYWSFWEKAPRDVVRKVVADIEDWRASRVFIEVDA